MASKSSVEDSDSDDAEKSLTSSNVYSTASSATVRSSINANEELVGNVSKLFVCPPGCNEKVKRGYLMFHACFQSGNLGRVDWISNFEYDLFVRPDTCNSRYRMWFNFTVQNVFCGQKVIFHFVNFSKTKSLYRNGMSPLVKSTSRPKWQRIPSKNVFYYRSPDHHKNYVMSFAFAFDKESDVYQFSYCYPYTYDKLQSFLSDIDRLNLKYVQCEQLCLSVQQKKVDLLTITSPHNQGGDVTKKVLFFTARVHPGETPASFVCQGIISFLISDHPIAQTLRDHLVFKIVPMLNPDGVVLGNYRCSLMGFDLNRYWHEPASWAHPSILATKQLLIDLNDDPHVSLDFYIDLHAHSTALNGFMYGNVYEDDERFEQHSVFPRLLCSNSEDFSFSNTSFNKDAMKAGTGRRTLGSCLSEQSNCYTLEVSFFGYISSSAAMVPYNEEGYIKLGRNVVRTFLDYYKLNSAVLNKLGKNALTYERLPSKKKNQVKRHSSKSTVMHDDRSLTSNRFKNTIRKSLEVDVHTVTSSFGHIKLKYGNPSI